MNNLTDEQIKKMVEQLELCVDKVYTVMLPMYAVHEVYAELMSVSKQLKSCLEEQK